MVYEGRATFRRKAMLLEERTSCNDFGTYIIMTEDLEMSWTGPWELWQDIQRLGGALYSIEHQEQKGLPDPTNRTYHRLLLLPSPSKFPSLTSHFNSLTWNLGRGRRFTRYCLVQSSSWTLPINML